MTQTNHTPGPWHVTKRDCGDNIFADNRRIANTYGDMDNPEYAANARLIAAAPELLAALEAAHALLELAYEMRKNKPQVIVNVRAAIANATNTIKS